MEGNNQTATFCNDSGVQKRVNFNEKMNRESKSFSPAERAEPSSTKVKQSETKKEDSQWLSTSVLFPIFLADLGSLLLLR